MPIMWYYYHIMKNCINTHSCRAPLTRLNGIPNDYGQSKHNWIARSERKPTRYDYPIWFQTGGEVSFADRGYDYDVSIPLGFGSSSEQDKAYTHWQPAIVPKPIKVEPEPSVMERLLLEEDIRKAEEALDVLRKKLSR